MKRLFFYMFGMVYKIYFIYLRYHFVTQLKNLIIKQKIMKKTFLIMTMAVISIVIFASCEKEESVNPKEELPEDAESFFVSQTVGNFKYTVENDDMWWTQTSDDSTDTRINETIGVDLALEYIEATLNEYYCYPDLDDYFFTYEDDGVVYTDYTSNVSIATTEVFHDYAVGEIHWYDVIAVYFNFKSEMENAAWPDDVFPKSLELVLDPAYIDTNKLGFQGTIKIGQ